MVGQNPRADEIMGAFARAGIPLSIYVWSELIARCDQTPLTDAQKADIARAFTNENFYASDRTEPTS